VQTKGFVGKECRQASQFIEQALGVTLQDRNTAEFFAEVEVPQHAQQ
jgi:hypothetical protein